MARPTLPKSVGAIATLIAASALSAASASAQQRNNVTVIHGPPASAICKSCAAPGEWSSPPPPAGFDPLTASPYALDFYGFPPRPNPMTAPRAYGAWVKMATAPVTRIAPHFVAGNLSFGPVAAVPPSVASPVTAVTNNAWSGIAITDASAPFRATGTTIYTFFTIPSLVQPNGTCSSKPYWYSAWGGIDGYHTPDVFQAGVTAEVTCASGHTTITLYPFTEWYPAKAVYNASFAVDPGDTIGIESWNTSSTNGKAIIVDFQHDAEYEANIAAPAGTSLGGTTAEWIVEAPSGGYPANPLANYGYTGMFNLVIAANGTDYDPASPPAGSVVDGVTMEEGGVAASEFTFLGTEAIWLNAAGYAKCAHPDNGVCPKP